MTFSEWLDWSQLYALTERVEETVFEDGREKQRGRVMPLRHLSLLLYYWAYVRSVRLYGIFKGTYLGYTEAVDKALEKAKNIRKGFPLEIKCKSYTSTEIYFFSPPLVILHRHQERRQWHSLVAPAVRQDVSRQAQQGTLRVHSRRGWRVSERLLACAVLLCGSQGIFHGLLLV